MHAIYYNKICYTKELLYMNKHMILLFDRKVCYITYNVLWSSFLLNVKKCRIEINFKRIILARGWISKMFRNMRRLYHYLETDTIFYSVYFYFKIPTHIVKFWLCFVHACTLSVIYYNVTKYIYARLYYLHDTYVHTF